MIPNFVNRSAPWVRCALVLALIAPSVQGAGLSLKEAERMALDTDPMLKMRQAKAQSLRDKAVAEGQLPDPQLTAGVFNVPLDSFSMSENPTTQIRFGIVQAFPRGRTLAYRQEQAEFRSQLEEQRKRERRLATLRDTRLAYFDAYYRNRSLDVIRDSRRLFTQLVEVTESQYTSGLNTQQDLLRAQLELSRLEDRETRISEAESRSRAELARWVGEPAFGNLAESFPELPEPVDLETLEDRLMAHPLILAEDSEVAARRAGVKMAREQYKPGFSLGLEYRLRQGSDPDGSNRSDMMAAMVRMDLPLFTDKRQDRRLAASQQEAVAARWSREDRLLELRRALYAAQASWARLGERLERYEKRLLPEARATAQASFNAYQSAVTEFTTLMRARLTELEMRIDVLRLAVERAKVQVTLLYLGGAE